MVDIFPVLGGATVFMMYFSVYLESKNLSGRQIGILSSAPYFITLVSSVIFGFLSDISKRNRLLIQFVSFGLIAILFVFPRADSFWKIMPMVLFYSLFHAPINPILDQTILNTLDDPENYGKIRAGGSIGWGLSVLLTGFLIENLGLGI